MSGFGDARMSLRASSLSRAGMALPWPGARCCCMPIMALAALPGVQLISLQKGRGSEQVEAVAGHWPLTDLSARLDETAGPFMDTAAVMMNLDLVVTSDTSIPHLVGALGVPVWVALPKV